MRQRFKRVSITTPLIDPTKEILNLILLGILPVDGAQVKRALLQQYVHLERATDMVAAFLHKQGIR